MAAHTFKTIRKSYIIHLLFVSIISNLTIFGMPLQQIVLHYNGNRPVNKEVNNHNVSDYEKIGNEEKQQNKEETYRQTELLNTRDTEPSNIYFASEQKGIIGTSFNDGSEDVIDNIFSITFPDEFDSNKYNAVLSYELYGLADASQTTKSINDYPSYGGKLIVETKEWISVQEQLNPAHLNPGLNEIFFNRRIDENYQYKIKDLKIELKEKDEQVVKLTGNPVNFNGTVYLTGTVSDKEIKYITAFGNKVPVENGIFDQVLNDIPKSSESISINYQTSKKELHTIKVPLIYQDNNANYHFPDNKDMIESTYYIDKLISECVSYKALHLKVDESYSGAVGKVSVKGLLFKDIKPLDTDLKNVTEGYYTAYRIKKINLPDTVAVQVHIKYDPEKIPDSYTAKDIRTFYFDKSQRNWKALPVDSLDYENREIITSIYNNDTDFINGVIKVPESPETGSFAPTMISDMKYADPAAGIVSIAPPSANNTGSATTNFPIKLPQGRNGIQPSLDISYNSEAGNGWMGVGWNLSIPAITVNTKWGVPIFNPNKESEIYSLNGSDLVFKTSQGAYGAPHRLINVDRGLSDKRFYNRKESGYQKIMRHGNSPSTYWWEVTDKQGNKSFYGGYNGVIDNKAVQRADNGGIVHWGLVRTQDTYGNYVEYIYADQATNLTIPGTTIPAKEYYIDKIRYTRHASQPNNYYEVAFKRNAYTVPSPQTPAPRTDITVNARNRYIQVVDDLLTEIQVSFVQSGTVSRIRSYRFDYSEQAFGKQQLSKVSEYDTANKLFYSHTCEYYNDLGSSNIINSGTTSWSASGSNDEISSPLHTITADTGIIPNGSPLGSSVSEGFSFGMRAGAGIGYNPWNINTTFGGSTSYSSSNQESRISFIDINGDGLPDKVYKDGNNVSYRPNSGNSFGGLIAIGGIDDLSTTKSKTFGYGFDANAFGVVGVGKSWSTTRSETDNYFTDFNGDGLPDIVKNGRVYFNTTNQGQGYLNRNFDTDVTNSENVIFSGPVNPDIVDDLRLQSLDELRGEHPQYDHVKVWQAPYSGNVNITGCAALRDKNDNNGHDNQFRLVIEKADGSNVSLPSTILTNESTSSCAVQISTAGLAVDKGDLIFFRVHNLNYGSGGEVEWNPLITYTSVTQIPGASSVIDENGKQITAYNAKDDFILNNEGGAGININGSGSVVLKFNLSGFAAYQFSDDITFKIRQVRINLSDGSESEVDTWERFYNHKLGTISGSDTYSPAVQNNGSFKDIFYFEVESNSNVNWGAINWKPQILDLSGTNHPGVNYKTYDNNVNQIKYWINSSQLPEPQINIPAEEDDDFMVIRHTMFTESYGNLLNQFQNDEFPLRINWVVKGRIGSQSQTLHSRTFFIHKLGQVGGQTIYTFKDENGTALTPNVPLHYYNYALTKQQVKDLHNGSGRIYSAFYIDDRRFGENNSAITVLEPSSAEEANYPNFEIIIPQPFMAATSGFYGYPYRGWGQFLYNGGIKGTTDEEGNVTYDPSVSYGASPIDVNVFSTEADAQSLQDPSQYEQMPTTSGETAIRYTFYNQQNPDNKYVSSSIKDAVYGYNSSGQLTAKIGRFAEPNLYDLYIDPDDITMPGSNVFVGMKQRSISKGDAESGSVGIPGGPSADGTLSDSESEVLNMHMDLNGDRYPDIVSGQIQYTDMTGALASPLYVSNFYPGDKSEDLTVGMSVPGMQPNSTEAKPIGNKTITNVNAGINDSEGESLTSKQWADINGDGLPDKVFFEGTVILVSLNKGYEFSDAFVWQDLGIELVTSVRESTGIGAGFSFNSSFAFGFGGAASSANMNLALLDINGDGLPDVVYKNGAGYSYKLNTGYNFNGPSGTFYGSSFAENDYTVSGNVFGSFTGGISIPTFIPGIAIKITYSPSGGANASFNEKRATVQDINGDGLPDVIGKGNDSNNNSLTVRLNKVGKTNLLKKVNLALGGSWTVDYEASQKSYNMPNHKWLLNEVRTDDGFTTDNNLRPGKTLREITYTGPKYDRREREFLGFGTVTVLEKDGNVTTPPPAYRSIVTSYHNENYYLSGAQKKTTLYDQSGQLLSEEETLYNLLNPDAPIVNFNAEAPTHFLQESLISAAESYIDRTRLFIAAVRVISTTYEGSNSMSTVKDFKSFDNNGNLKSFLDYGEDADDAYKTTIEYYTSIGSVDNSTGFAKKISVHKESSNQLMRERSADYTTLGKILRVTTKLNQSDNNRVEFEYDTYGNVTKVKQPDNLNAQSQQYYQEIAYDNVLKTFPVYFKNAFAEESYITYNYLFGIPVLTTDMNDESMRTRIDNRGRVVEVAGPNEMALGTAAWTIRMQYKGEAATWTFASNGMRTAAGSFAAVNPGSPSPNVSHYAVTRHFDPEITNNQINTISISDGFGQAIQVKKIHKSGTTSKWMVTGFDMKDAYGRTIRTHLPAVQTIVNAINPSGNDLTYYAPSLTNPLIMTYDTKDRVRTVKQPGESQAAQINYEIQGGMLVQKNSNELSQTLDTYTDVRGRTRKTVQNGEITTIYEYNAINELLRVTDNGGFVTNYIYDLAGRQTEAQHPDRGIITMKYNKAGNLIEKSTSNLTLNGGLKILYQYDFNRLIKVTYPEIPQNEVIYKYGKPNDALSESNKAVGRLLYQEDASGVQVFGYGRMGEVTKNLRSVAVAGYQSFWFLTLWEYDSWNRLQKITYPDQEEVYYNYNNAGMLDRVYSTIVGISTPPLQDVIKSITYNDYGERTRIVYGNNTETNYTYDVRRRMNLLTHKFVNMQISNKYEYDVLSNIKSIITQDPQNSLPSTTNIGGPVRHTYEYDEYNRLTEATGIFTGSGDTNTPYLQQQYTLSMEYNTDHTIRRKEQLHQQGILNNYGGSVTDVRPVQKTSYVLDYQEYGTGAYVAGPNSYGYQQPHAPRKIVESPSWSGASAQYIKSKEINYDANGNQTEITQRMGNDLVSVRKNLWDEENRLIGVDLKPDEDTNHPIAIYTYNAAGERGVRYNLDHIDVASNATEVGELRKDNIMIYPNGLVMGKVIRKSTNPTINELVYTKHYYVGAERISAKTGTIDILGMYPAAWLGNEMPDLVTSEVKKPAPVDVADANAIVSYVYNKFGVQPPPLGGIDADDKFSPRHDANKLNQFYFHKDHLGSSSYISNQQGKVSQHMEYMAFGETLAEEHVNSNNSPYKFNGKEYDEETGNYYYGARYYDPKFSIFISVDPLADKYPGISSYAYCFNNPIKYIDPTGMEVEGVDKASAQKIHDDMNKVFADKKFDSFRSLLTRGAKNNKKKFDNIDESAFKSATKDLKGDDLDLATSIYNSVNSEDIIRFEYVDSMSGSLSTSGGEALADYMGSSFGTRPNPGDLKGEHVKNSGKEGLALPTKEGSHVFIMDLSSTAHLLGKRELTSFHEGFGHGLGFLAGLRARPNQDNAIRYENLVRRVMGITTQRDGTNPFHGAGKVSNHTGKPIIKPIR